MFADERQELILREVRERGSVRLSALAERLDVSMVTLRRDVDVLAGRGLVKRVHGGITRGSQPRDAAAEAGAGEPEAPDQRLVFGMLVPTTSYYYPTVIKGAREQAERYGARIVLGVSRYDEAEERSLVAQFLDGGVDGLLLTPSRHPDASHDDWLASLTGAAVMVERQPELGRSASRFDAVASHHAHGAFLAARHLTGLGHSRLGLAARPSPTTPSVRHGFLSTVRELGLDDPVELDIDLDGPTAAQVKDVVSAISHGVTAIVAHNDVDALSLVQHLHTAGVRVPQDLSVVAYDDEVAALSAPALTAVAPPKETVGRRAVDALVRRIDEGPTAPVEHTLLLPELKLRESTDRVP
ncbi:LacI family DNA-binding transcriptional regulator [Streptomyces sp. PT12]|uniref:LacI family DNA-binding transcriptional regulator n=1 Tax=Streptomyces sp. PT12 TaxID=1510197 RepID=UPI0011BF212C|nr:LacI family DNA-binding transcriptional regulator [Streptomyces sp. PT12]